METYLQAGLDALGDRTRMAIFQKLSGGPVAVNELARTLPVSRPAVSQHLRVLKDAGLVTDTREGTRRMYQLNPEGVARLRAHFDQMWTTALSSFQAEAEKVPVKAVSKNASMKHALIPNTPKKNSSKGEEHGKHRNGKQGRRGRST